MTNKERVRRDQELVALLGLKMAKSVWVLETCFDQTALNLVAARLMRAADE